MIKFTVILDVLLVLTLFKTTTSATSDTISNSPLSELFLPTAQSGDQFGWSISASNNLAIVGSPYATINSFYNCGSASIWQYDPQMSIWNLLTILDAYDHVSGDNFGSSVSLSSSSSSASRVLVGSLYHYTPSQYGAAYLYEQESGNASQWNNITQFIPLNLQAGDLFGFAVILSPLYAAISAPFHDEAFTNDGTVYLFGKDQGGPNGWGLLGNLNASDPHTGDSFGSSVAIDGDLILVGSIYGDSSPTNINTGTAYLFSKDFGGPDNWGMIRRFTSPNLMPLDEFGISVSISGDFILIGAQGVQIATGMAHSYYRNNGGTDQWGFVSNISLINGQSSDLFGSTVAMQGSSIIIAANGVDSYKGAVYIGELNTDGSVVEPLLIINDPTPALVDDQFGTSVWINNNLVLFGAALKSGSGKAYSTELIISSTSPLSHILYKMLIIIGISIAIVIIGGSIGIRAILHRRNEATKLSPKNRDGDYDLLEFSPQKDMNFIDIHGPNHQKKRRASIESGTSIKTTSTQYSNITSNTALSSVTTISK